MIETTQSTESNQMNENDFSEERLFYIIVIISLAASCLIVILLLCYRIVKIENKFSQMEQRQLEDRMQMVENWGMRVLSLSPSEQIERGLQTHGHGKTNYKNGPKKNFRNVIQGNKSIPFSSLDSYNTINKNHNNADNNISKNYILPDTPTPPLFTNKILCNNNNNSQNRMFMPYMQHQFEQIEKMYALNQWYDDVMSSFINQMNFAGMHMNMNSRHGYGYVHGQGENNNNENNSNNNNKVASGISSSASLASVTGINDGGPCGHGMPPACDNVAFFCRNLHEEHAHTSNKNNGNNTSGLIDCDKHFVNKNNNNNNNNNDMCDNINDGYYHFIQENNNGSLSEDCSITHSTLPMHMTPHNNKSTFLTNGIKNKESASVTKSTETNSNRSNLTLAKSNTKSNTFISNKNIENVEMIAVNSKSNQNGDKIDELILYDEREEMGQMLANLNEEYTVELDLGHNVITQIRIPPSLTNVKTNVTLDDMNSTINSSNNSMHMGNDDTDVVFQEIVKNNTNSIDDNKDEIMAIIAESPQSLSANTIDMMNVAFGYNSDTNQ